MAWWVDPLVEYGNSYLVCNWKLLPIGIIRKISVVFQANVLRKMEAHMLIAGRAYS